MKHRRSGYVSLTLCSSAVDLESANEDEVRAGKDGETGSSLHRPSLLDSEKAIDGERNVRDSMESAWRCVWEGPVRV